MLRGLSLNVAADTSRLHDSIAAAGRIALQRRIDEQTGVRSVWGGFERGTTNVAGDIYNLGRVARFFFRSSPHDVN